MLDLRPKPGRYGRSIAESSFESITAWVLHVDLDQFLAAVEVRRRPELAGLPVIVGGDGNPRRPRQVVATASYEARAFGVHSGMPLAAALRKCPQAVFLAHDRPAYDAASAEVMATLRTLPVIVEVWGWDEAFLGATTADPEALAHAVRQAVHDATQLSCAVGIGETRLMAKTATGWAKRRLLDTEVLRLRDGIIPTRETKPGGVARLDRAQWFDVMGERPVTAIWGIGGRTADRLGELGVTTVHQLAWTDLERLQAAFGPRIGAHLKVLGLGGDDSPIVDEPWVARSRSREETFEHDLAPGEPVAGEVVRLAREVTESVVAEGRSVTHVAVKLRTAGFFTRTRSAKLNEPSTDPAVVAERALVVLARFDEQRPIRLIGVRVVLDR